MPVPLSHGRSFAQNHQLLTAQGAVGPVGSVLAGHQVKSSAHGFRQVDVYPKMNAQVVGTVAPPVVGKDWDRPPQKTQYGWKWQDLRAPDTLHEPVLNELAQYSWKNKIATTVHAADLSPANRFVPRRSAAPFVVPRDYVPRGGQVPRVTDLVEGDGRVTPLTPNVQAPPITSLAGAASDATLGLLFDGTGAGGGGAPFTPSGRSEVPTSIAGLYGTRSLPGPSLVNTANALATIAERTASRQQITDAFAQLRQQTGAIETALSSLQASISGQPAITTVGPTLDEIQATLQQIRGSIASPEAALTAAPYTSNVSTERYDTLVGRIESIDRSAANLAQQISEIHAAVGPRGVQSLLGLAEQVQRYEEHTTRLLALVSDRVGELVDVNVRTLTDQQQAINSVHTQLSELVNRVERGQLRPEELGRQLDLMSATIGRGLQALAELTAQGFNNQAGASITLRSGQQEMAAHLADLEAAIATLPVDLRPQFHQFTAVLQQWNITAHAAEDLLPRTELPIDVGQSSELVQTMNPDEAPPNVIDHIAPAPPPNVLINSGTLVSGGASAGVYPPRFGGGVVGRPGSAAYQHRLEFDGTNASGAASAPLSVPINEAVAAASVTPADGGQLPPPGTGLPGDGGSGADAVQEEGGACPLPSSAAAAAAAPASLKLRYTQYPYPPKAPAGTRRLYDFDRSKSLLDQRRAFYESYGNLGLWNTVVKPNVGARNRALFFAIVRAYNLGTPEATQRALDRIRSQVAPAPS